MLLSCDGVRPVSRLGLKEAVREKPETSPKSALLALSGAGNRVLSESRRPRHGSLPARVSDCSKAHALKAQRLCSQSRVRSTSTRGRQHFGARRSRRASRSSWREFESRMPRLVAGVSRRPSVPPHCHRFPTSWLTIIDKARFI